MSNTIDNTKHRNVFISILGTNNYIETCYQLGEKRSKPVRFIQEALIDMQCADWTTDDRIVIFCTKDARRKNWENNGQEYAKNEIEKIGLKCVLEGKGLTTPVETVGIPEGYDEREVWTIFETIYAQLQEGDRVYFDVTHSFRSIPLFTMVLFSYAEFLKKIEVVALHYGAFERLGAAFEVVKMPVERRIAPILDLKSILSLQGATLAASDFEKFGKMSSLANLFENYNSRNGGERAAVNTFKNNLRKFDQEITTCRMQDIEKGDCIRNLFESIKALEKNNTLNAPQQELLKSICNNLHEFSPLETKENIKAAVNWTVKYELIQQAYTMGQEYIITRVAEYVTPLIPAQSKLRERNDFNKTVRQLTSAFLAVPHNLPREAYKEPLSIDTLFSEKMLNDKLIVSIKNDFTMLTNIRNGINHAKTLPNDFAKMFKKHYYPIIATLESYEDAH